MSENKLSGTKLIVGLGNPGKEYQTTRHNAGSLMLEHLRNKWHFPEFKFDKYANAMIAKKPGSGISALIFPQTFMNESGKSIQTIMNKENVQPEQLLVIHDDKDILFGEIKIQKEISSAGHKGVQSIIDCLQTNNYWRLRIGIGPVPENIVTDVFVLQNFTKEEQEKLPSIFETASSLFEI